jgi:ergothioneine biosynthesis protein EgtB
MDRTSEGISTGSALLSGSESLAREWPSVARFHEVRRRTLALCETLTAEDMMVQSCPEASPAKWHLAHTAWFFESFVLKEFLCCYQLFNPAFPWLFNSYYRSFSAFPEKCLRSSFSRPGLEEVLRYREYVDHGIGQLLGQNPEPEVLRRIALGVNHEEQHQELLLTDILHAFFTNPLHPAYREGLEEKKSTCCDDLLKAQQRDRGHLKEAVAPAWVEFSGGMHEAGFKGQGFCYDNELPRHQVWLEPFEMADRLVTCGEFAAFIADGGYRRPELWLSNGWDTVERNGWKAPLYWNFEDGTVFSLHGELPLAELQDTPVSQVSFYEADAYARWAGARLPTEFEWEVAAEGRPMAGNLLEAGQLLPAAADSAQGQDSSKSSLRCMPSLAWPAQQFGDCWEWTASAYLGYPGYKAVEGALGEYNGKFMSGLMVLRGGSCVTPEAHIRASYRNFFAPETRWQFSGIRLAK